jgi:hypothetical protein
VAVAVAVAVALPVALEVAVDVEVAVEVEVAVDVAVWWSARAMGANSRTITTVALNKNTNLFMNHPFQRVGAPYNRGSSPTFPFSDIVDCWHARSNRFIHPTS